MDVSPAQQSSVTFNTFLGPNCWLGCDQCQARIAMCPPSPPIHFAWVCGYLHSSFLYIFLSHCTNPSHTTLPCVAAATFLTIGNIWKCWDMNNLSGWTCCGSFGHGTNGIMSLTRWLSLVHETVSNWKPVIASFEHLNLKMGIDRGMDGWMGLMAGYLFYVIFSHKFLIMVH